MRKRKWYERMSAAALIAVLLVNHGDMGIMAKAETITALEENLEEENKKIEAETASASNADEKRDTTVDSNETTESDLEKETATASNGKETPEIKRKMAKSAMNAEPAMEGTYSISQSTDGTFQVRGGSLEGEGTSVKDLTDAIETILNDRANKKVTIEFKNIRISSGVPQLKESCELTLTGSYENTASSGEAFHIGTGGTYIIHNEATVKVGGYLITRDGGDSQAKNATVKFEQESGKVTAGSFLLEKNDTICLNGGELNGDVWGNNGNGQISITNGTWNGKLNGIGEVNISGGELINRDSANSVYAITNTTTINIRGGRIYAENQNNSGNAFAINMKKNTQLTLSGNIDVSASGKTSGSIYYGWASTYPVINAENVQNIGENFLVVPCDTTMKVNPVSNWIMGSKNNIEYLCKNIKLKVVNAYDYFLLGTL